MLIAISAHSLFLTFKMEKNPSAEFGVGTFSLKTVNEK